MEIRQRVIHILKLLHVSFFFFWTVLEYQDSGGKAGEGNAESEGETDVVDGKEEVQGVPTIIKTMI